MPRWLTPSKQKVLKALLKGSVLLPFHAASETAALPQRSTFRFATAFSSQPLLSTAIVECINAIKAQFGPNRHPHFCQLLVTTEAYGSHIEYAPSFVQECLSSKENDPPVVIGGAVQGLLTNRSTHVSGVSLFAAHMPDVQFMPFHVKSTSLPELTASQWDSLIQSGNASEDSRNNVAAVLMSEPHFIQVDELISRIQGVLPSSPLVGGVTQPNAWGVNPWGSQRSLRGALFIGNRTHDEGAVGCFMRGPFQMDALCDQGCRPVGQPATVTSSHGGTILQLNHQTALLVVRQMFQSLSESDREMQVQMGLDTLGDGTHYVARSIAGFNPGNQSVQVAVADVPEGSVVQLHVRDPHWARRNILKQIQRYVSRLPEHMKRSPEQLGTLLYSCATLVHEEEKILQEALPESAFQGAQFQGEFGPIGNGLQTKSFLQSYSSSFGLLRQA